MAKAVNLKRVDIQKMMKRIDKYEEAQIYPIGGALIDFLLTNGGESKLKELLKEQTWDNLVDLYGIELIKDFEEKIGL